MSLTRKLIDLARSNLNALLEKAADSTDPRRKLASIPDAELEAELERRRTARRVEQKVEDAKARVTSGEAKAAPDRAERERQAKEREARVRAERAARAAREQASRPASPPPPRPSSSSSSSSSSGSGPRPGPSSSGPRRPSVSRDPQVTAYYQRLEVPIGSDWETVKAAYRRLMRKYHPDLHGHKSPEKLKAATEVSQALTQAYNELEKVLVTKGTR